jgi:hypothetical protein
MAQALRRRPTLSRIGRSVSRLHGVAHHGVAEQFTTTVRSGTPRPLEARQGPLSSFTQNKTDQDQEGSVLHVEPLDAVDGTPVVDIKPYAYGWDSIFSARSARPMIDSRLPPAEQLPDGLRIARHVHGEACPGIVIGVRATLGAGARLPHLRTAMPRPADSRPWTRRSCSSSATCTCSSGTRTARDPRAFRSAVLRAGKRCTTADT